MDGDYFGGLVLFYVEIFVVLRCVGCVVFECGCIWVSVEKVYYDVCLG